jgi:UDP-glucuronate 4-epimerase
MKTVLVTGGAGFIGSNTVAALLEKGYRVICLDNFASDLYDPKFKEINIEAFKDNPHLVLYRADICDFEKLKEIFETEKPNYVVHLAAIANTRKAVGEPHSYMEVNIGGTLNILELCKEYEVENLAFASSSSVYGNSEKTPWREDDSADRPLSPYGMTKRSGEVLAFTYHHNFGMNITCLRYFNAYGENNRPDLVPYVWGMAILESKEIEISGDGSRKRDYTYIGDIVDGTIRAMEKPLGFEIINLGNHDPISLKALLEVLEKVTGSKANVKSRPSHKSSVEATYADVTKAKELLGWEPTTPIEVGVTKLVEWLRNNRLEKSV